MMEEAPWSPFWMTVVVSVAAFFLVNILVTGLNPPPKPKFERMPPPILTISKPELDRILAKNQRSTRSEVNDGSTGTSASSSVTESLSEKHGEIPEAKDDLLGSAELLLQRASQLSGKTPRSLDKPKPGKGRSVYPKVIEVLGHPSASTEGSSMTEEDEELKIAMAVSAFEAAVNRSREAHRKALAAEKEQQARRRQLAKASTAKTHVACVPCSQPATNVKPKQSHDVLPKRVPVSPYTPSVGDSAMKTIDTRTAKPKPFDTSPQVAMAVDPQPRVGKTKTPKNLSKARQNALRLSTLSDEALAAMAKTIHTRATGSKSTSAVEEREEKPSDTPLQRPVSQNTTEPTQAHEVVKEPNLASRMAQKRGARQQTNQHATLSQERHVVARKVADASATGQARSSDSPTWASRRPTSRPTTPARTREQKSNAPNELPLLPQEKPQPLAMDHDREDVEKALLLLEKYRQVREAARAKQLAPTVNKAKPIEKDVSARKPVSRDDTPPRSNRTRDFDREAPAKPSDQKPSLNPTYTTKKETQGEQERPETPVRESKSRNEKRTQTPTRKPKRSVHIRRKSRTRLESLMS